MNPGHIRSHPSHLFFFFFIIISPAQRGKKVHQKLQASRNVTASITFGRQVKQLQKAPLRVSYSAKALSPLGSAALRLRLPRYQRRRGEYSSEFSPVT